MTARIQISIFFIVFLLNLPSVHSFNRNGSPPNIPRAGGRLTFFLNPNMPAGSTADQISVLNLAMDTWTIDGGSNFSFIYGGTTTTSGFYNASGASIDGQQIVIADACGADWTGVCNCDGVRLGYTYGMSSDPDIIICSGWNYYVSIGTSVLSGDYDLVSLLIHELGHTLGLDHSNYSNAVMVSGLPWGTIKRTLWDCTSCTPTDSSDGGDVQGVRSLYGSRDSDGDGFSIAAGDCNDGNASINPGAVEICNGVDDNCDNRIDPDCDDDGDGIPNGGDNCPRDANADQTNTDGDGLGDACDSDDDNDGVPEGADNCPLISNGDQLNTDGDSLGNACDLDDDNDGLTDVEEAALGTDPLVTDTDGDGLSDSDEVNTHHTNPLSRDSDQDGIEDAREISLGLNPTQSDNPVIPIILSLLLDGGGRPPSDLPPLDLNSDCAHGTFTLAGVPIYLIDRDCNGLLEQFACGDGELNDIAPGASMEGCGLRFVNGTAGDDSPDLGALPTLFAGGPGADSVTGSSSDDLLLGGLGNDSLHGGGGNDSLGGGSGRDRLWGEAGNDTLFGGPESDYLRGNEGDDQIEAGLGHDFIFGDGGNDLINGGEGSDYCKGGEGDDQINGGPGSDYCKGDNGNDTIDCGAGSDLIRASGGDDRINACDGVRDFVYGNEGSDTCTIDCGVDRRWSCSVSCCP